PILLALPEEVVADLGHGLRRQERVSVALIADVRPKEQVEQHPAAYDPHQGGDLRQPHLARPLDRLLDRGRGPKRLALVDVLAPVLDEGAEVVVLADAAPNRGVAV